MVLLDTALPSRRNCFSYLLLHPRRQLCAFTHDRILPLLKEVSDAARRYWVCGYLSYEASYTFENRFISFCIPPPRPSLPLGWFAVFDTPYIFNHLTGRWNNLPPGMAQQDADCDDEEAWNGAAVQLSCGIGRTEYGKRIGAIKRCIGRGDTYQVNFTFRSAFRSPSAPFALYREIRTSQPAAFCAYIAHEHGHIASFSPELFFDVRGRSISVKPMKGTARRGRFLQEDAAIARALSKDAKNRAENVMIVDLLRNDLGRICRTGSVHTTRLFEVETLPTLHQMTSTVRGVLRPDIGFGDIIRSLFPSGSVTGAPKIRAMEIIRALEDTPRGVYTGAIGFISPHKRAVFSVAIRTLERPRGSKCWRFGVGGGIVWDSSAALEWRECGLKSRFLTVRRPLFELVETIRWEKGVFAYLIEHVRRLRSSAAFLDFSLDPAALAREIRLLRRRLRGPAPRRIRILCARDGHVRSEVTSLLHDERPHILKIARRPIDENEPLLFHKTTYRPWYEAAMKSAARRECYDTVFCNSRGEITECAMNNIFIKRRGILYTPPIACGLLPGVLRAVLLKRGKCREKILRMRDLQDADAVYCGNSVRGLIRVYLDAGKRRNRRQG